MYQKPSNLGQLLLKYWFVLLLALVAFAYFSGWLPAKLGKVEKKLWIKTPEQSQTDSLYKAEQGKERREIMNQ